MSSQGITLYDGSRPTPGQRINALQTFKESREYGFILAEYERARATLEERIFNPKTAKDEREALVLARRELTHNFAPEKLVQDGIAYAKAEQDRLNRESTKQGD
jgi:hypothetical protein